ncbi:MAG: alpha/beta fold hydrolase [Solirubrobacterales bacterium]|nr:alpha/beta fold hydrolase [Solirubrobacterales bacterium]
MALADYPPVPPLPFPPARTVTVPDRGEFFLRDSGGEDRPTVLLLHGWIASADLNWASPYQSLTDAGYRVLAIDHRGHGRGLRPLVPFRLADCAADAAAVLRTLELAPAICVGYSMGGTIAQLMARDHPDVVSGMIVSGTAQHWQDPELKRAFRALGLAGAALRISPRAFWSFGLKQVGLTTENPYLAWLRSELLRHNSDAITEAGRELSRFDSRPWLRPQPFPTATVLTTKDSVVPPRKQRELAEALGSPIFEAEIDHLEVPNAPERYDQALLAALSSVRATSAATR